MLKGGSSDIETRTSRQAPVAVHLSRALCSALTFLPSGRMTQVGFFWPCGSPPLFTGVSSSSSMILISSSPHRIFSLISTVSTSSPNCPSLLPEVALEGLLEPITDWVKNRKQTIIERSFGLSGIIHAYPPICCPPLQPLCPLPLLPPPLPVQGLLPDLSFRMFLGWCGPSIQS